MSNSDRIARLHPDIIKTHILTRLDGESLAAISSTSPEFKDLASEATLWQNLSSLTWPSITDPRLQNLISSFPFGHRCFFSDAFPAVSYHPNLNTRCLRSSSPPTEVISAVDIYYQNQVMFSGIQETHCTTEWFQSTPFRVDILDPKVLVPTSIQSGGSESSQSDSIQLNLEVNLRVSWILIDPATKKAVNLSSIRAVSVQKQWFSGDIQVIFGSIFKGGEDSQIVQCRITVMCGGEEGGKLQLKEVCMQVEDMDGRMLNGNDSLVLLQNALQSSHRKKIKTEEVKQRYQDYVEVKRLRKQNQEQKERMFDFIFMFFGFSVTFGFWSFFSSSSS